LDGLRDDDIRFEVEYNKEPETIDDAVFQVVSYINTRNMRDWRSKENIRWASETRSETDEDEPIREINKVHGDQTKPLHKLPNNSLDPEVTENTTNDEKTAESILDILQKLESKSRRQGRGEKECYNSHKLGHFACDCPERINCQIDIDGCPQSAKPEGAKQPLNYKGPALVAKGRSSRM
jgi:hypothetical protein